MWKFFLALSLLFSPPAAAVEYLLMLYYYRTHLSDPRKAEALARGAAIWTLFVSIILFMFVSLFVAWMMAQNS